MNRILLVTLGLLFFGCDKASKKSENSENNPAGIENTSSEDNSTNSVQEGAGTEISPQLEGIDDSASRLKVDTAGLEGKRAK